MNTIDFNQASKIPVWLNDFSRMQDSYLDILNAILKAIDPNDDANFIVSGCEVTTNQLTKTISSGFVWIDGELHKVHQQSFSSNLSDPVLRVVRSDNPDGARSDYNNVSVSPWKDTSAEVIAQADLNQNEAYCSVSGPYLMNKINELITPDWIDVGTLSNGWTTIPPGGGEFKYRKNNGQVQLKGGIGGGLLGSNIFQLPSDYKPSSLVIIPLIFNTSNTNRYYLHVDINGYVKIYSNDSAQQDFYINVSFNL